MQGSTKKAISLGILCLSGLLILYVHAAPLLLGIWLSLTVVATVLLLNIKDRPRVYILLGPSHGFVPYLAETGAPLFLLRRVLRAAPS